MTRLMIRCVAVTAAAATLAACETSNSLYYWGDYEQALYSYSKRPGELDKYVESLGEIVTEGEERNKVPPGMYAEFGYALMTAGREDEAMAYFQKERDKWPEAGQLMGLMIDGGGLTSNDDAETPATVESETAEAETSASGEVAGE